MITWKKWTAWLLLVSLLLTGSIALAEKDSYTTLYSSEYSTLNYLTSSSRWDQRPGANTIDTLVEYNALGQVIPSLAESWETSEDGLTWTFHLRQGQKWVDADGNEKADVTAQDFVDALRYVLTPENESAVEYAVETAHILNAAQYYRGEVTDFAEVGVKAIDAATVQYTLESATPYFLSCLTYGCFMPAYGPLLNELGKDFATDNTKMYFCGAYLLKTYEPQTTHVYVRNDKNWDAANVHIATIEELYNAEANTLSPTMAMRGEVDSASLSNDIVEDWKASNPELVTRDRLRYDFSYFYCFNFDPKYDASYGPDNWRIAVNNEHFRQSIMKAFDRSYVMRALEPDAPETLLQNTLTPTTFTTLNGTDYTRLPAFDGVDQLFFNADAALTEKTKAMEELTAAGATFPINIVLTYKSGSTDWENECILFKQQLEGVLGSDYITVTLYAGPSESFLSQTRRAGVYSIMRCNWGADYADPETWTDPFQPKLDAETGKHTGNSYNRMDVALDDGSDETKATLTAYYAAVDAAKASVIDLDDRYTKFSAAERMLIDHAIVIPYGVESPSYMVTKLSIFDGAYAPFGMSSLRYKYRHVNDDFVTADAYQQAYDEWLKALGI